MKPAVSQAILLVMTTGLFASIIRAIMYLSDNMGGEAVISLGVAALFYVFIPTIEEPEQSHDPYDI